MEYWKEHNENLKKYGSRINKIYDEAIREIIDLGYYSGGKIDENFEWDKIPQIKEKLDKFLAQMSSLVYENVIAGITTSWNLADKKNDSIVASYINGKKVPKEKTDKYMRHNQSALDAFIARKERGMNLSERVWKLTEEFKQETEYGIEEVMRDGIPGGVSAESLQRKVKQYLNEPNKIFRRVRDKETGELKPSRAMKDYHPGQGVYRSSRKNALRMTITETNMAFHEADTERISRLDFVLAIRVVLSNNHTCNGVPFVDICDRLQGVYPKNFHFIGWHPHCRCHVETILKSEETMEDEHTKKRNEWRKKAGLKPIESKGGKEEKPVKELPQNYLKWKEEYGKTPYWEERVNEIKRKFDERKKIYKELGRKWKDEELNVVQIDKSTKARRTVIKVPDWNGNDIELIVSSVFYGKTFDLNKRLNDESFGDTMNAVYHYKDWVKNLKFIEIQRGRHHDFDFMVFETMYKGKKIYAEAKMTEGIILYCIRLI